MSESSYTPRQSLEYLGRMALGHDYADGYEIAEAIWTLEEFLDAADEGQPVGFVSDLSDAAAWIADTPRHPMPDALWDALVDHVYADESGIWHANELSRDEVDSWLADEAGRNQPADRAGRAS